MTIADMSQIMKWFEMGSVLKLSEKAPTSAGQFLLDGLYVHRRIRRNEEPGCTADIRRRKVAESVAVLGLFLLSAGAGTRFKLLDASVNVINVTDRLEVVTISSLFS